MPMSKKVFKLKLQNLQQKDIINALVEMHMELVDNVDDLIHKIESTKNISLDDMTVYKISLIKQQIENSKEKLT